MKTQPALSRNILPYLALLTGILALSFSALFVRWANAPGLVTTFYRMSIASLVLLPALFRPQARAALSQKSLWIFPIVGGLFTALDHSTWSTSIGLTRVANATLLNNLAPLWVALFALIFWREKLARLFWLGLFFTLSGAVVVLGSDMLQHPTLGLGDLIAVVSSLAYAGYYLISQRGRTQWDALTFITLVTMVSAVCMLGTTQAFGLPLTGYDTQTYLAFAGAALISQIGGHFSLTYALGHLPASIVSPTMIAQPVLTALIAIPLVGENLQPAQWIGGLAVLSGIYLINRTRKNTSESSSSGG